MKLIKLYKNASETAKGRFNVVERGFKENCTFKILQGEPIPRLDRKNRKKKQRMKIFFKITLYSDQIVRFFNNNPYVLFAQEIPIFVNKKSVLDCLES